MKKILAALLICISFLSYGQSEVSDTTEDIRTYYQVYPTDYIKIPSEEIYDYNYSRLKRLTYKPIINLVVTDSINKFRIRNGVRPIKYDTVKLYSKLFDIHMEAAKNYAKTYDAIFLVRDNDTTRDCECAESIFKYLTDDTLTYTQTNLFGKEKDYTFKDILLEKRIKEINVVYYQFRLSRGEIRETAIVFIRKRFSLIVNIYAIFEDQLKEN
jgi:hypothetical protein